LRGISPGVRIGQEKAVDRTHVKKKPQPAARVRYRSGTDRLSDGDAIDVKTIYDLLTMVIFAGLVVLFLQRSTAAEPRDHMYQYAPPAVGCAVANYLGNHGQDWVAVGIILAVVGYVLYVLKPFNQTL
jgi:hypothetical protein